MNTDDRDIWQIIDDDLMNAITDDFRAFIPQDPATDRLTLHDLGIACKAFAESLRKASERRDKP